LTQEYLVYSKENWQSMGEKEPPFGYDDNFQTSPKRQRAKLNMLAVISLNSEESELLATYDEIDIDVLYGDEAKREDFQIFKMVAVEGRSMRETADEFGISIEACKKRVQRIKKRLQKKLSKE